MCWVRQSPRLSRNEGHAVKAYWCDLLGFRVLKKMEESGPHIDAMMGLQDVRVTTVKMVAPDERMIELLHFHSHPDQPAWNGMPFSTGFTHVALTVDNLDEAYQKLSAEGVVFKAAPQRTPDGGVKVIYCQGPEGVLLELVEVLNA
jgi:catechol 2,3-dioxygenase-like lactoylglutathione lyase family enzyme